MATQDTPSTARTSRDVLHERLRSLTYEVDHTAANPANHVVETRTLTDANRSPFNHIIPKAAPFFAHTVRIFHTQTNDELINGQDFYCVGTFVKAVTNVVNHREVNWAIIFDDKRISGEYRIEYQTVGGEFVLDQQQMAEILANFVENPRSTDWESIVGRPLAFPPLPHDIHVDELMGFNEQVKATNGVEEAIRALLRDEEQDHPGYGQVITELFRQQQRQDKFQQTIDDMRVQNTKSNAGLDTKFTSESNRIETESKARDRELENRLTTDFNSKLERMDTAYKAADNDLTGKLNKAKTDLTSDIKNKDTALRKLIEEKDTAQTAARSSAVNALTQTLNSTASDIRREFQAADRTLDGKIESLRTSTTTAIASSLANAKAYTDSKFNDAISNLNGNVSNLSSSTSALEARVTANKKTSDEAEAALRRDLTAEIKNRTDADNALDGKITNLTNSLNSKETTLSNRITTNKNNHDSLVSQFNALKGRVDGNTELVKVGNVNQEIGGTKTFTNPIHIKNPSNAAQAAVIGFDGSDFYINNPRSNKFLQLKDNGELQYDNKRVLLIDDFNNLNNAINGVRNSLGDYVPTNGNHTINNEKTFTSRVYAVRYESNHVGWGAYVGQFDSKAPYYVHSYNNNNQSTYYPFIKGRVQNNNAGWSSAISFGALGHLNVNKFPDAIIHAKSDQPNGENNRVWRFETDSGNLISANDVSTSDGIWLRNTVQKSGDQDINGVKRFRGRLVQITGDDGLSIYRDDLGFLFHYYGGSRRRGNPHFRLRNEGFELQAGQSVGYAVGTEGDQTISGWKSFSNGNGIRVNHYIRAHASGDWNSSYGEMSHEPGSDNQIRFWANGRNRYVIKNNRHDFGFAHGDAWTTLEAKGDSGNYILVGGWGRWSFEDIYVRSDIRFKENLEEFNRPLDKLSHLKGYTYNMKGQTPRVGGIIAQDLEKVLPELVYPMNEDGKLSISYNAVTGLLVSGINELQFIVKQQAERIRILEEKLNV